MTLLWNAMGAFDYLMTQTKNEAYLAQFTPEQLEFYSGFPAWVVAFWAMAGIGGILFSAVIFVVAALLFLYARAMSKRGVIA